MGCAQRKLSAQWRASTNAVILDILMQSRTGFDLGVVVSFGSLLPACVLNMFKHGIVNVHPSLLPKYRGASPIQYALLNGDDVTGVSVMGLSDGAFDKGPVLAQRKVSVPAVRCC